MVGFLKITQKNMKSRKLRGQAITSWQKFLIHGYPIRKSTKRTGPYVLRPYFHLGQIYWPSSNYSSSSIPYLILYLKLAHANFTSLVNPIHNRILYSILLEVTLFWILKASIQNRQTQPNLQGIKFLRIHGKNGF